MKIIFSNHPEFVWPKGVKAKLDLLLPALSAATGRRFSEVSLVLVTPAAIKRLNRLYRRHNRVTDVLSFLYQAEPAQGDIIICLEQARRQARRYRKSLPQELVKLVIHGGLHLLGYDHRQARERSIMRKLEKELGRKFGL